MKQANFYLTEKQITKLKELSRNTGLSVSEHIRRAIDSYLNSIALDSAIYAEVNENRGETHR